MAHNSDLIPIERNLKQFDSIKSKWTRVINRMVPEKATSLLAAAMRLNTIESWSENMKPEQRSALLSIGKCFVPLTI